MPQFYATMKVHKTPTKTRPIVSTSGSYLGYVSKWLDSHLQKVIKFCPSHLKDSAQLLRELKAFGRVPSSTRILKSDATSMYTNIDPDHCLDTLKKWLQLHKKDLPNDFPDDRLILEVMETVMKESVFQFGDTFWRQISGVAMGTPAACAIATIYYSYHEETSLFPLLGYLPVPTLDNPDILATTADQGTQTFVVESRVIVVKLLFYRRLIDDAILLVENCSATGAGLLETESFTKQLETKMAFGKLPWEAEHGRKNVDFLDLTLMLHTDGSITSKTYVKPNNLHLYIPPLSAHAPGVLKSLVAGTVRRYWLHNTNQEDFRKALNDFLNHLLARGHTYESLTPIFEEVALKIDDEMARSYNAQGAEGKAGARVMTKRREKKIILHWEYHPSDVSRRQIQQAFQDTLQHDLSRSQLGVKRLVIAYSVSRNLRKSLTSSTLHPSTGNDPSNHLTIEQEQPP
jgi:hypothetical protein